MQRKAFAEQNWIPNLPQSTMSEVVPNVPAPTSSGMSSLPTLGMNDPGDDFLSPDNLCGQNLLRLTARGSGIVAELLRLSTNIPEAFLGPDQTSDMEQLKYGRVLYDFQYLRAAEDFEKKLNDDVDLLDLDQEFQENHEEILKRFYNLFESIWKYWADMCKYIEDVKSGVYIQHSLADIVQDVNGKQLMCEVLYLYGVMLLLLEEKIPGTIREKMMIAIYRFYGVGMLENIEDVFKLCRNTGYVTNVKKPKNHPVAFFGRFPIDPDFVKLVLGALQGDDIYLMATSFPNPDHRSTRLAGQASMLYVILYFLPEVLDKAKPTMREVVDKHFNDNWVLPVYMGHLADLQKEWASHPAAKEALDNVLTVNFVKMLEGRNRELITSSIKELKFFLNEGVLQPDYLLDNMGDLLNCARSCNIAFRWRVLHRRCSDAKMRAIVEGGVSPQTVVTLLLNTSQFEFVLKDMLQDLLDAKEQAWTTGKADAAARMTELSEYFTGEKALTRVKRNEDMMAWFASLAKTVTDLSFDGDHATAIGRKIQKLCDALEEVERFEAIDTNAQIKAFLQEARDIFKTMIRTVNIKHEVLSHLEHISDASYAWVALGDYLNVFHEHVHRDPTSVVLLRATFLKTASILDVPLIRITAIDSADAVSVAEYYSSELVEFVRRVLEVIPVSVFKILSEIEQIQTHRMAPVPSRLEAKDLKDYAQLDLRFELSKATHHVSIFTEGILVMQRTLLGVIQIEPKSLLQEGLRRELVRLVTTAMHSDLHFKEMSNAEIYKQISKLAATLDGLKRSIEYLQDYIDIAGLKIYQQEMARVINYHTEQEANRYVKKKTFDGASRYQSRVIPIPRFSANTSNNKAAGEESVCINFMGQTMNALLYLTDPTRTIYVPECSAWFVHSAADVKKKAPTAEVCGLRTFSLLERALGVIGIRSLDRLFSFRAGHEFSAFLKFYATEVHPFRTMLDQIREVLFPEYRVVPNASKLYSNAIKKVEKLLLPLLKHIRKIGQGQLIRRQIAHLLQFSCQMDAQLLFQNLDALNAGIIADIRKHYRQPDKFPYPSDDNPLLGEVAQLAEACGLDDPMDKIYVTSQPLEGIPVLLFLFLIAYLPKMEYDENFGTLVRKKAAYPLDGVPLAVGLACLLRQFHPAVTRKLLAYLGQFVRTTIQQVCGEVDSKVVDIPLEVLNTLIFMDQLCHYTSVPRSSVHAFVPAFIFDRLDLHRHAGKK